MNQIPLILILGYALIGGYKLYGQDIDAAMLAFGAATGWLAVYAEDRKARTRAG